MVLSSFLWKVFRIENWFVEIQIIPIADWFWLLAAPQRISAERWKSGHLWPRKGRLD
jgi:hypothetical protein